MRARLIGVCALSLCLYSLSGCASDSGAKKSEISQEEMMAKWSAYMTPGAEHKVLDSKVGNWTTHAKMWMDPHAPATEMDGTSEIGWVMGGRYLHESYHSSMMGQPFEGAGMSGYDNLKKKYIGGWVDNMSTGLMTSEGTYDAAKKTFTSASSGPDLIAGKYVPMRMVETHKDADHFTLDMFAPDADGKEYKSMEIAYTRSR
jgi:Protein of unknown function (DUF1579)